MSFDGWSAGNTVLVLGGIRSGKSAFAESLVSRHGHVHYVATSTAPENVDMDWVERLAAHRARRPTGWTTEELGREPGRLPTLLADAKPDDVLLIDDLGGWITAQLDRAADALAAAVAELAEAVRNSAGHVVIVSPEVGLSVVPPTELGRSFADEVGRANQALAAVCDGVVLVVAGQPSWLKRPPSIEPVATHSAPAKHAAAAKHGAVAKSGAPQAPARPAHSVSPVAATLPAGTVDVLKESTVTLPALSRGLVIQPGMNLPLPDEAAALEVRLRLRRMDVPGGGLGALGRVVEFAAATQGTAQPQPWQSVRVLLVHGDHDGAASAGDSAAEAARRASQYAAGEGALGAIAAEAGLPVHPVPAPVARPMETEDALTAKQVDEALSAGWKLAEDAADEGVDLLVIASCGAGAETAATAVTAAITSAEPVALLGRVPAPDGRYDDHAWMARCAAVRDALHRTRARPRRTHDLLASLGGGDLTVVTGILLGAAARRTPVLLDGPVGAAAGLLSRDIGGQARHWCMLPDHSGHPMVVRAADVLDLDQVLDLRLGLGEGAAALIALPILRSALTAAAALGEHPALAPAPSNSTGVVPEPAAATSSQPDPDQAAATSSQPDPEPATSSQPDPEPALETAGAAPPGDTERGAADGA